MARASCSGGRGGRMRPATRSSTPWLFPAACPRCFRCRWRSRVVLAGQLPSGISAVHELHGTVELLSRPETLSRGTASSVWIAKLSDSSVEKVPRKDSNDSTPMWLVDQVYFLSDRDGPENLYLYDTKSKQVNAALASNGVDIKSASAGPDAIVYEQFGSIHLFDPATGKEHTVPIQVSGDFPAVRPHYVKVGDKIANANVSPTGARAVFEAHGEILTVPVEHGDIRNLTNTVGVAERDPAWSPDGKW